MFGDGPAGDAWSSSQLIQQAWLPAQHRIGYCSYCLLATHSAMLSSCGIVTGHWHLALTLSATDSTTGIGSLVASGGVTTINPGGVSDSVLSGVSTSTTGGSTSTSIDMVSLTLELGQ